MLLKEQSVVLLLASAIACVVASAPVERSRGNLVREEPLNERGARDRRRWHQAVAAVSAGGQMQVMLQADAAKHNLPGISSVSHRREPWHRRVPSARRRRTLPEAEFIEQQGTLPEALFVDQLTDDCISIDMSSISGDDGGMLWYSNPHIWYEGDRGLARYNGGTTPTGGVLWKPGWGTHAVHADPINGKLYELLDVHKRVLHSHRQFSYIQCLNKNYGRSGLPVKLARTISMGSYVAFMGGGEVAVQDKHGSWFVVQLGCGRRRLRTTYLGKETGRRIDASSGVDREIVCERGQRSGILERDEKNKGKHSIVYPNYPNNRILRREIPSGKVTHSWIVNGMSDACSLTVDYERNLWYWHGESAKGKSEALVSCKAKIRAPKGFRGPPGARGKQPQKAYPGPRGAPGKPGAVGRWGHVGPAGNPGEDGVRGEPGADGEKGKTGAPPPAPEPITGKTTLSFFMGVCGLHILILGIVYLILSSRAKAGQKAGKAADPVDHTGGYEEEEPPQH